MACLSSAQRHRIIMASFIRTHASDIVRLFEGVSPADCQANTTISFTRREYSTIWKAEVMGFFRKFNAKLDAALNCKATSLCETSLRIHTMEHVAHILRYTPLMYLWISLSHKMYDVLVLIMHGKCFQSRLKQTKSAVCEIFASVEKFKVNQFVDWKKDLKASLCRLSAKYLWTTDRLHLQMSYPQAAVDTLFFRELYDFVLSRGDKRLAILFLSVLPEMLGASDMPELLQYLSMQMHKFVTQVIKTTEQSVSKKLIRMFFAAAGQCTCHTKCSVYGRLDDIKMLAVCKVCRRSPMFRQVRDQRCRRTICSTSFMNVCSIDCNTSFMYIPLYRAQVDKKNGQLIYEHWAYTLSFNSVESDKASFYMLCAGGRRTCTNVFLTDSLNRTQCEQCRHGNISERTCLTERVSNKLAILCDGCIIAACCPIHAPMGQSRSELWLSILESFVAQNRHIDTRR